MLLLRSAQEPRHHGMHMRYDREHDINGRIRRMPDKTGTVRIHAAGTEDITFDVESESTVDDLLKRISAQLGTNPYYHAHDITQARLLWRGRALQEKRTLASYGLPADGEPLCWHPRVISQRGRLRPLNSTARGLLMTVGNAPFDPAR